MPVTRAAAHGAQARTEVVGETRKVPGVPTKGQGGQGVPRVQPGACAATTHGRRQVMPTWCTNYVDIQGSEEALRDLKASSINDEGQFDFHLVRPMPDILKN